MLTLFTVTSATDGTLAALAGDGKLSLREAIEAANTDTSIDGSLAGNGPDVIQFDVLAMFSNLILLTDGELQINDDLVINGPGNGQLTIDASGNDPTPDSTPDDFVGDELNTENDYDGSRIFNITSLVSIAVTIRDVTLTGGDVGGSFGSGVGGAILCSATLTLDGVVVTENFSENGGGGVYASGPSLTVLESEISDNEGNGNGGGIAAVGTTLTISNSRITGNAAGTRESFYGTLFGSSWGGGLYVKCEAAVIHQSIISGNGASGFGGGLYLTQSSNQSASISRTLFADNEVATSPLHGSLTTLFGGGGAAINNSGGTVSVSQCWIKDNIAGNTTTMGGAEQGGPIAVAGGGLRLRTAVGGTTTVLDSTISGNRSRRVGGGIDISNSGVTTISNSTISANSADGGFGAFGLGGGIDIFNEDAIASSQVVIEHSTITLNRVPEFPENRFSAGGGIHYSASSLNRLTLNHSIVSGNIDGNANQRFVGNDHNGDPVFDFGISNDISIGGIELDGQPGLQQFTINAPYSLIGDPNIATFASGFPFVDDFTVAFGGAGRQIGANPLLGPLQNNGGFELPDGTTIHTHALLSGSPAINAGDISLVAGSGSTPLLDERGQHGRSFTRIHGGRIDLGAFEVQPLIPIASDADFNNDDRVDGFDFLTWQRGFGLTAASQSQGDADIDNDVDGNDFTIWKQFFGTVQSTAASAVFALFPAISDDAFSFANSNTSTPSPGGSRRADIARRIAFASHLEQFSRRTSAPYTAQNLVAKSPVSLVNVRDATDRQLGVEHSRDINAALDDMFYLLGA